MKKITYPAIILTKGKDNNFYWKIKSSNGRTILRSVKGYKTKQNAMKNLDLVFKNGVNHNKYYTEVANQEKNGFYYALQGRKFDTILAISGNGKNYKSVNWQIAEMGSNKGIDSCIRNIKRMIAKIKSGQEVIIDKVPDKRKKLCKA